MEVIDWLQFNWRRVAGLIFVLLITIGFLFLILRFSSTLSEARFDNLVQEAEFAFESRSFDEAFDIYQKTIKINPDLPAKSDQALGQLYLLNQNQEKAAFYFEKALEQDPQLSEAHYFLGLIYAYKEPEKALQQLSAAEDKLEKAKKFKAELEKIIQEENPAYKKALLGHLFLEEDQAFLALFPLRDLVSEQPRYRDAHTLLGAAYLKLGRKNRAEVELKKALEIDPNHKETKELLEKLSQD